ncbi:MAG: pyridoxal phosphate-dependent aminotransferase [Candidatus Marinimicrobia bacterium]|nr:pyridoxal phosphate-dependent aminotransferase [Candidatus Neomarinimicrobiota bacterium]
MQYNFDEIINRRGTNSIKWDAGDLLKKIGITERFDEQTISLWVADMDFACPPAVLAALRKKIDQRMFGYTAHYTSPDYYGALINWFSRRMNWKIHPEEIVYCPGTVHALNVAVRAFTKPGDGIIIQRPVYAPFTKAIEENNRNVVNNELINADCYYTMDFADLEEKAKDLKNTMMILCSPHNPVGRIWNADELRRIAQICRENNVLLIADEIHGDLIRCDQTFTSIANVADTDNIVIGTAINKTFNVAGLHVSNIVIKNKELREKFQNTLGMASPSPFGIATLIAAYNESEDWLEQLKVYIDGNFDLLEKYLAEKLTKVKYRRPEGTYMAWLDFSGYGLSPEEVHKKIYVDANVTLEDGKVFGKGSEHFQRICLPSPGPLLKEALDRIVKQFE